MDWADIIDSFRKRKVKAYFGLMVIILTGYILMYYLGNVNMPRGYVIGLFATPLSFIIIEAFIGSDRSIFTKTAIAYFITLAGLIIIPIGTSFGELSGKYPTGIDLYWLTFAFIGILFSLASALMIMSGFNIENRMDEKKGLTVFVLIIFLLTMAISYGVSTIELWGVIQRFY